MPDISYSAALVPVRDDFAAAHTRFWKRLASPGAWWTGAERVAIAYRKCKCYCATVPLGAHPPEQPGGRAPGPAQAPHSVRAGPGAAARAGQAPQDGRGEGQCREGAL